MSRFFPTMDVHRVTDITPQLLYHYGVEGLIVDIDNTLTHHGSQEIDDEIFHWIQKMKQEYPMILLSNNNHTRVQPFAEMVGLPYISNGGKPLFFLGLRKARQQLGLPPSRVALVGDQLFTDVLGGNLAHITTILVEPMHQEEGFLFSIKRFFEDGILQKYYKSKER